MKKVNFEQAGFVDDGYIDETGNQVKPSTNDDQLGMRMCLNIHGATDDQSTMIPI